MRRRADNVAGASEVLLPDETWVCRGRFEEADIAVLVLDASELDALDQPAAATLAAALELRRPGGRAPADGRLAVVLNKADLLPGAGTGAPAGPEGGLCPAVGAAAAAAGVEVDAQHSVSCEDGTGVDELVEWLAEAGWEMAGGRPHADGQVRTLPTHPVPASQRETLEGRSRPKIARCRFSVP